MLNIDGNPKSKIEILASDRSESPIDDQVARVAFAEPCYEPFEIGDGRDADTSGRSGRARPVPIDVNLDQIAVGTVFRNIFDRNLGRADSFAMHLFVIDVLCACPDDVADQPFSLRQRFERAAFALFGWPETTIIESRNCPSRK